jgi:hypothetical protein
MSVDFQRTTRRYIPEERTLKKYLYIFELHIYFLQIYVIHFAVHFAACKFILLSAFDKFHHLNDQLLEHVFTSAKF